MDRRDFLRTVGLGAAGWATASPRPDPSSLSPDPLEAPAVRRDTRPNILFIFSDDHAPQSIRSYANAASIPTVDDRLGNIARSAHIDRIGAEGARVDHCFCTNSICCPSRASVLTGQYSHRHGVYTLEDGLDPDHPNVAKALRAAGYRTALFGKWHLKEDPAGFDDWLRLPGQGRYVNPKLKAKGSAEYTTYEGFSSDVITDQSIRWMRAHADEDAPFLLMTNYKTCHGPFAYPDRNADLFTGVSIPEPPSLWEDKAHRSPGSRDYGLSIETMARRLVREPFGGWTPPRPLDRMTTREMRRHAHQRFVKRYLRSAAAINQGVGRLLDALEKMGVAENTIVVYSSDQGYYLGEHNYIDKRWMYEESLRMPFLIRYPDGIEPGTTVDDLVLNVDMAPTLLDFAGLETPDFMQGESSRAQLQGTARDDWRDASYYRYWYHTSNGNRPAHYGIRTARYKLIFFYGLPLGHGNLDRPTNPGMELYDLAKDPQEMDNVYGDPAYRDVANRLKQELLRKKRALGDTDEGRPELLERRSSFF